MISGTFKNTTAVALEDKVVYYRLGQKPEAVVRPVLPKRQEPVMITEAAPEPEMTEEERVELIKSQE